MGRMVASDIPELADLASAKGALAKLWRARQFHDAATLAAKAMALWPEDAEFRTQYAKSLLAAGALIEAEAAAREALLLLPESEDLWIVLADALIRQERSADARESLREACFAMPESAVLHGRRGHQAMQAKDYAEAIDAYQLACDLAPEREAFHLGLLSGLWHAKRYAFGGTAAGRAVALFPESSTLRQQQASFLLAEGRAIEAADVARAAIRMDAKNAAAHWSLVDALWRQDRFGEAFRTLEGACAALPSNIFLLGELARLSIPMERRDAVILAYQRAIALPEMPPQIWRGLVRALIEHEELQEAVATARRAVLVYPHSSEFGAILAETLLLGGMPLGQVSLEIAAALGITAESIEVRYTLISGLLALGKWDAATVLLEELRAIAPDQPELLLKFGIALTGKGNFNEAIVLLLDLTDKHPENLSAWEALCDAHRQAKQIKSAVAAYRRLQVLGAPKDIMRRVQTRLFGEHSL
jgi:tetratricopeptide (TPR) repeat protein